MKNLMKIAALVLISVFFSAIGTIIEIPTAMAQSPTVILLAPAPNTSFSTARGNVYVSDNNGLIINAQSADVSSLQQLGCVLLTPRNNVSATRAPLGTDDFTASYGIGSQWVDVAGLTPALYVLTSMTTTPGSANWVQVPNSSISFTFNPNDFTISGSTVSLTNPFVINDPFPIGLPSNGVGREGNCYTNLIGLGPGFTQISCEQKNFTSYYGDHSPAEKTSFATEFLQETGLGAGQHFLMQLFMGAYGAGDHQTISSNTIYYGGVSVSGDEGPCGICLAMNQPNFQNTAHINSAPTTGGGNTTVIGAITGSQNVQTVSVVSATGFTVNEWVEINNTNVSGLRDSVQLTAVNTGANTISGIFRISQSSGVNVTPATLIPLSLAEFATYGQHRYLVDDTGPTYSTGTATVSNATVTGTGTAFANNMVGGNSSNRIGCIEFDGDISAAGIPSWYAISSVNSATSLTLESNHNNDVMGGVTTYKIRPCMYILRTIPNNTNTACCTAVVVENNSFTLNSGDVIETSPGPALGAFAIRIGLNDFLPGSNSTGMSIGEEGLVTPSLFLGLVNFSGHAVTSGGGSLNNAFITANDQVGGQIAKVMTFSKSIDLITGTLQSGALWTLDHLGLLLGSTVENSFSDMINSRGSSAGPVLAGAMELNPIWQYTTNTHTLFGANITDTSTRTDNMIFDVYVNNFEQFAVRADGTITKGSFSRTIPGIYSICQSSVPFIIAPTGTMANNGALTLGTALDATYASGAFFYLPANAISSGSSAGWYWGIGASTTAITLYNNTYTNQEPIPNFYGVGTPFVTTGPGAYTGVTTAVTGPQCTIAGSNASRLTYNVSHVETVSANTDVKTISTLYGGSVMDAHTISAAANAQDAALVKIFAGVVPTFGESAMNTIAVPVSARPISRAAIDMTSSHVLQFQLQMATATDYLAFQHFDVEMIQGP